MRNGDLSRREFRDIASRLRVVLEHFLEIGTATPGIAGSCKDILAHRDALWRFVDDPHDDPTVHTCRKQQRPVLPYLTGYNQCTYLIDIDPDRPYTE